MNERKFYETIVSIKVLSERPITHLSLRDIGWEVEEGDCVGSSLSCTEKELTPKEAVEALNALGSEPEFFQLDSNGNDLNDSDHCVSCEEIPCVCDLNEGECRNCISETELCPSCEELKANNKEYEFLVKSAEWVSDDKNK